MSANAPPIHPAAPRSAIRPKRPPGRGPGPAVSAARRYAGALQSRGTHARRARELPRPRVLRQPPPGARRRLREKVNPRDGRRRECWYRWRSCAAILVSQIAQALTRFFAELLLQPLALEARSPQLKRHAATCLGDDMMQPALHQRPQRDPFPCRDLADFAQQRIGNLNGCLHRPLRYGYYDMAARIYKARGG